MVEERPRRQVTAEFKAQAVRRVPEGGRGLSEVAAELDVSSGQLSTWRTGQLAAGWVEALAARKVEESERLLCQNLQRSMVGRKNDLTKSARG